jgi:phospholipid/cholesterol/gamma-HCH transport system substrate-binding protein
MKGLSLEVRVGLLIMVALVIMGGFLFLLGGVHLEDGYTVYVDFNNPGGIKPGAPVRVAGVRVGTVENSEYLGGKLDPKTGKRPLVRIELSIDSNIKDTIHEDALFYVTSQGVLGEPFVAVDPGSPDRPVLREGAVMHGIDPPRLDLALAMGYELLETMVSALRDNREELQGLLSNAGGMLKGMNEMLGENHERINRILVNVETATSEGTALLQSVRQTYVDGAQPKRIIHNLDRTLAATSEQAGPLMQDMRGAVSDAREVLGPEQREKLKSTISDAAQLADKAKVTLDDAQQIMTHMKRGQGTVGALLMDEAVYDDVQEMLRDLKHNPWKFFWRE